jgi:hypothetical protein
MTTTVRPLARTWAVLVLLLTLAACGSSGSTAVTSSRSLDELGTALAKDGTDVEQYLAGVSNATGDRVTDDASTDRSCPGGARRTFRASFTAKRFTAGESDADLRGAVGMGAQARLKPAGYHLTTKSDGGSLPAALTFENSPGSADQKRTFRTVVEPDGDSYTWTVTGQTACIAK